MRIAPGASAAHSPRHGRPAPACARLRGWLEERSRLRAERRRQRFQGAQRQVLATLLDATHVGQRDAERLREVDLAPAERTAELRHAAAHVTDEAGFTRHRRILARGGRDGI